MVCSLQVPACTVLYPRVIGWSMWQHFTDSHWLIHINLAAGCRCTYNCCTTVCEHALSWAGFCLVLNAHGVVPSYHNTYLAALPYYSSCTSIQLAVLPRHSRLRPDPTACSLPFLPHCMECRRGLAMRILSVRPSVCLSVKRVHCDKTEERSVQICIAYERSFSLVLWEEEWLVEGDPFYLKLFVSRPPLEQNLRFWTDVLS